MKHSAFHKAGKFRDTLVCLIREFIRDTVLVNHLLSTRNIKSFLEDGGVVVRCGDVHDRTIIRIITFKASHTDNLNRGCRSMGSVRSAVGAREHGDGVIRGIDSINYHVLRINLNYMTGLKNRSVCNSQGSSVCGDGSTLIGGSAGRSVFIFQPFDFVTVAANLELGTCRIKAAQSNKQWSVNGVNEGNRVIDNTDMGGRIGIRSNLLVINCH
jgi:hypothetical protein